jgi:dihydrofolate synthase/folylpolyglutamate synthase
MNYYEARTYIDETMKNGSVYGLDVMNKLLTRLGNPHDFCKVIHVAGTNGKGSTVAYISSILSSAGYKTGRYISPSVFDYLEKMQINEVNINQEEFAKNAEKVIAAAEAMKTDGFAKPTAFEIETATAFLYFLNNNCDFVVLETGLGGSLDATNVVKQPVCSVITSVSKDHMQILGNTLEKIAESKAGIIKYNCPAVLYPQNKTAEKTIMTRADKMKAPVFKVEFNNCVLNKTDISEQDFDYISGSQTHYEHIIIHLPGKYQMYNACTAIEAIEQIKKRGYEISADAIKEGLYNTKWSGRFECVGTEPYFFIDGAHNPDAAKLLRETIEMYFINKRIIFIIGILADKEYKKIAEITAPSADIIYTVTPDNSRALNCETLADVIRPINKNVVCVNNIAEAVNTAYKEAGKDDVIIAFGSLSYLKDIKSAIESRRY